MTRVAARVWLVATTVFGLFAGAVGPPLVRHTLEADGVDHGLEGAPFAAIWIASIFLMGYLFAEGARAWLKRIDQADERAVDQDLEDLKLTEEEKKLMRDLPD